MQSATRFIPAPFMPTMWRKPPTYASRQFEARPARSMLHRSTGCRSTLFQRASTSSRAAPRYSSHDRLEPMPRRRERPRPMQRRMDCSRNARDGRMQSRQRRRRERRRDRGNVRSAGRRGAANFGVEDEARLQRAMQAGLDAVRGNFHQGAIQLYVAASSASARPQRGPQARRRSSADLTISTGYGREPQCADDASADQYLVGASGQVTIGNST